MNLANALVYTIQTGNPIRLDYWSRGEFIRFDGQRFLDENCDTISIEVLSATEGWEEVPDAKTILTKMRSLVISSPFTGEEKQFILDCINDLENLYV